MNTYYIDKCISLGMIAILMATSFMYFSESTLSWKFLISIMIIAGYTHHFLGAWYQWKSLEKRSLPAKGKKWFMLLSIGSMVIASLFLYTGYTSIYV